MKLLQILDLPLPCFVEILNHLPNASFLALFCTCRSAARMLLQHTARVRLQLYPRSESSTALARRHEVALSLAASALELQLTLQQIVPDTIPAAVQDRITAVSLREVYLTPAKLSMLLELPALQSLELDQCSVSADMGNNDRANISRKAASQLALTYTSKDVQALLSLGPMLCQRVVRLNLHTPWMEPCQLHALAAQHPAVQRLFMPSMGHGAVQVLARAWQSVQHIAVLRFERMPAICLPRCPWQYLDIMHPDLFTLAALPLVGLQRLVLHGALHADCHALPPNPQEDRSMSVATLENLRACTSVALASRFGSPAPGMESMAYFRLERLREGTAACALRVMQLVQAPLPDALVLENGKLASANWLPALQSLPSSIRALAFVECTFEPAVHWTEFVECLPDHVHDLAIQAESYQQAVDIITALASTHKVKKLWLYMNKAALRGPSDWWAQLSALRRGLRPGLKLHLTDYR